MRRLKWQELKKDKNLAHALSNEITIQLTSLFLTPLAESDMNELVNLENTVFEEKIKNQFKSSS